MRHVPGLELLWHTSDPFAASQSEHQIVFPDVAPRQTGVVFRLAEKQHSFCFRVV
jgi:hypothetical protein